MSGVFDTPLRLTRAKNRVYLISGHFLELYEVKVQTKLTRKTAQIQKMSGVCCVCKVSLLDLVFGVFLVLPAFVDESGFKTLRVWCVFLFCLHLLVKSYDHPMDSYGIL